MYVRNLKNKQSNGRHSVQLYVTRNTAVYFDCFGIEHDLWEILNKTKDKSSTHNILRIQNDDSTMCGSYYITFIQYVIWWKTLLDYTNIFSNGDYKKNDKI